MEQLTLDLQPTIHLMRDFYLNLGWKERLGGVLVKDDLELYIRPSTLTARKKGVEEPLLEVDTAAMWETLKLIHEIDGGAE